MSIARPARRSSWEVLAFARPRIGFSVADYHSCKKYLKSVQILGNDLV